MAGGCQTGSIAGGNRDQRTGRSDRRFAGPGCVLSGPPQDCHSPDCAPAAPAWRQWRFATGAAAQRVGGDEFSSVVDLRRVYVLRTGHPVLDSKPSTAGEVRRRGSEGWEYRFSASGAVEFRPVTAKWLAASGISNKGPNSSRLRRRHTAGANISSLAVQRLPAWSVDCHNVLERRRRVHLWVRSAH